ncbi:MAG: WYL domain-containing protein, partial [Myxococcota bacterium]
QRGFELEQHLAEGFDGVRSLPIMDVTLQIRNPTALWARDQFFHPTQTIDDIDGGIEIRFRSGGSEAIIARVLSLGRDCTVIAPDELRTRVADEAQAIANHYTTSP